MWFLGLQCIKLTFIKMFQCSILLKAHNVTFVNIRSSIEQCVGDNIQSCVLIVSALLSYETILCCQN